jgi:heme/copper-type cytochrome/quinol oxidase subunit 2
MKTRGEAITYFALLAAIVALVLSVTAYASREGQRPQAAPPPPPVTLKLSMVVATFTGQGMTAHRWYPTMLVARKGDTVDLVVANPDRFSHQFGIPDLNVQTPPLAPGSSARLSFVADDGVFVFQCMLPHDPAKGYCTPDHELMRGYLMVTR